MAILVRSQQDLRTKLAALETRVSNELGAVDGKRNDTLIASLRVEASQARASLDEVSARIVRDFPGYAELASPAPLPLAGAAALLKPDEVLVSFRMLGTHSFVFAVTREGSAWQQIPLGAPTLDERVANLRLGLFNPDPATKATPFDLDESHRLYNALFGPVAGLINGKPKLLVVPSGALTSLPPQVLMTATPPPASTFDRFSKAAWLVNDKAITVLPSVSSLRALRSFAKSSRATRPFIGFGNPVFRRDSGGDHAPARSLAPYQNYYKGMAVDLDRLRTGLPQLPETADELRAVAHALGASDADLRLGEAASVTAVRQAALAQYRVIEFATHGLVAGEVGGLSEPALVLTLPDHPTEDDNGLLTASDVAKLSLDADWAVLSACNTAAGEKPGAEGLSGLARAFFYAGARALLVSHWPVESDAAVKLTTGAFSELAAHPGIGRAEALRRSMRALITLSPRNAEPSVWAPFVLVGEGG
jgi:CHAT domain-containing protein